MMIRKLISGLASGGLKGHFGQWGEDILVRKLFPRTMKTGAYLDLGCYHPFVHSNTAYLWLKGWSGVNVDANPNTIDIFNKLRPKDRNIWAAIVSNRDYEGGNKEVSLKLSTATGISATGTTDAGLAAAAGFNTIGLQYGGECRACSDCDCAAAECDSCSPSALLLPKHRKNEQQPPFSDSRGSAMTG
jgi:hypothetical protein